MQMRKFFSFRYRNRCYRQKLERRKAEKVKGKDRKKARVKSRTAQLIKRMDHAFRNKVANRREGEGCVLQGR